MRLIKAILLLAISLVMVGLGWYYQPWSAYSPHKIAKLDNPDSYVENFQNMDRLVPYRTIEVGPNAKVFPEQLAEIELSYEFNGQQKHLNQYLDESVTTGLLVLKAGVIRHERYFRGTNQQSLLTSWSVAKSFVATAIAIAHKEGLIESFDDRADKYAAQYDGTDFGASSIKSLLAMSSGVAFNEDYVSNESDIRPFFFDSFILGKNPDQLLAKFERDRPEFSDFHYISPNSHVLSAVLRSVYQKPLAQIVSEKIWQPMGMGANAAWLQHREGEEGVPLGYCCLNARLRDYARFGQFYLDALKPDSPESNMFTDSWLANLALPASAVHAPSGENYAGRGYSTHFWLPVTRRGVFFASGIFGQTIWIDPERDLVIVKTSADSDYSTRFIENEAVFEAISQLYD